MTLTLQRRARATSVVLGCLIAAAWHVPASAQTYPPDFVEEDLAPGVSWVAPVNMAFLPDGRALVAEKRGRVWIVKNGVRHPTPLWSRELEVLDQHDRGLLGIAVDPNYTTNRYVYFLYTVDPDSNNVENNGDPGFGRLTRYQVSAADSNALVASSRTILMGVSWPKGPLSASPSHTIGALQWGRDGSLLVSIGDGAVYTTMDPGGLNPSSFGTGKTDPYEDIGAFRAQYIGSLCGKILRINPANGHGYSSNPFWNGDPTSVQSRVWAYGLRNPYRFGVRPGTGSTDPAAGSPGVLYIGDVGWTKWEEISVATAAGRNFGWPCYEGVGPNASYQSASPAHHDCSTIGTGSNPSPHTPPVLAWHHDTASLSVPPGYKGATATGGVFYTGTRYPAAYRNKYFFGDYTDRWIRMAEMNSSDQLVSLSVFATNIKGPVAFATDPANGDLHYIGYDDGTFTFAIKRIRYTGAVGNGPPVAVASAVPSSGPAPLTVSFSSAGSSDPDGDPITFSWSFGDGNGSTNPNPQHTYTFTGTYQAILTVTDTTGALDRDTSLVVVGDVGSFPSTPVLDDFNRPDGPIGPPWVGLTGGLTVSGNKMRLTYSEGFAFWDATQFGSDQEAYVKFEPIATAAEHQNLFLKGQGANWQDGMIEVRYDATLGQVTISTYTPGFGQQLRGGPFPLTFVSGDQLGARAWFDGRVEVFRNGVQVATGDVSAWPFSTGGGRIGFAVNGAQAGRLDDFGGGNVVLTGNTPPSITITSPAESSFFAVDDTVWMRCVATDAEDPSESLTYRWEVDLHHNVHVHPNSITLDDSTGFFIADNHDDGTGVWMRLRAMATDSGAMRDTAWASIFPEIDLVPGGFAANRPQWGEADTVTLTFRIHNRGRMPAPISKWRLVTDGGVLMAEGDTVVAALDSVTYVRTFPPMFTAGMHDIRLVVDTLGAVVETSEVNNAFTGRIEVVPGSGTVDVPAGMPRAITLSPAHPNPSAGGVRFDLALPAAAAVRFSIHDLQGRAVWRATERRLAAGRQGLAWDGVLAGGRRAHPGLYLARVDVEGVTRIQRFVLLR